MKKLQNVVWLNYTNKTPNQLLVNLLKKIYACTLPILLTSLFVPFAIITSWAQCSVNNPAGSFDGADCNSVVGWALDQSDFSKTVTVDVYVDGVKVGSTQANGDRQDLVGAFGNASARYHGFTYQFPANDSWKNGQGHNVTTRICGASSDTNGSPKTVSGCTGGTTNPPSGGSLAFQIVSYDCNSGILQYQFTGGDGSAINVAIPGIFGGTMNANTVASYTFPGDAKVGRTVTGTATQSGNQVAINFTNGCNITTNPPVNPPTTTCSVNSPAGSFDGADCNSVVGWALDQSDFSKTVTVDIYVDGVKVGSTQANGDRQDLVGAFGNASARYHGFTYQFPANDSWKNGQGHNVTTRICGASSDLGGSPRTVSGCIGGTTSEPRIPAGAPIGRPLINGDSNLDPSWKWHDQQYNVFYTHGSVIEEPAYTPFYNAGTIVAYDDQHEEDGWMLVARDFGISPLEASQLNIRQDGPTLPFFVLYNKYTGKLRVFIYNPSTELEYSHHAVTLSLVNPDANPPVNPALLAFNNNDSTQVFVDDGHYDPNLTVTVLTDATKRAWSIADFNLACYDERIFNNAAYNNSALSINIANVTLSTTTEKGDLKLDGSAQPKSLSGFLDNSKTASEFGIKALAEVPNIVSSFEKGAAKAIEDLKGGITSALGLISAGSDLVNGLFGSTGSYDISLSGSIFLQGTTTSISGGSTYQIYLKRHSPRMPGSIYDPVQDIPWGIVGLKQLPTIEVSGHYDASSNQRVYTYESGQSEQIPLINYHAHGIPIAQIIRPISIPRIFNDNGIPYTGLNIQAAYFLPDGTPNPPIFSFKDANHTPDMVLNIRTRNFFNFVYHEPIPTTKTKVYRRV